MNQEEPLPMQNPPPPHRSARFPAPVTQKPARLMNGQPHRSAQQNPRTQTSNFKQFPSPLHGHASPGILGKSTKIHKRMSH